MEAGIPASRINTIDRALAEPQVSAREMVVDAVDSDGHTAGVVASPIKFPSYSGDTVAKVSTLGEDSTAVLSETLGMRREEIDALLDAGVVGAPVPQSKATAQ
jgi:crotonobetainyl-CoA:carnitine CoA-transferase CaiB-like acyl-CoA transferase